MFFFDAFELKSLLCKLVLFLNDGTFYFGYILSHLITHSLVLFYTFTSHQRRSVFFTQRSMEFTLIINLNLLLLRVCRLNLKSDALYLICTLISVCTFFKEWLQGSILSRKWSVTFHFSSVYSHFLFVVFILLKMIL